MFDMLCKCVITLTAHRFLEMVNVCQSVFVLSKKVLEHEIN